MGDFLLLVVFASGLLLVCYGVWLIHRPAGYITAGLALSALVARYVRSDEDTQP